MAQGLMLVCHVGEVDDCPHHHPQMSVTEELEVKVFAQPRVQLNAHVKIVDRETW